MFFSFWLTTLEQVRRGFIFALLQHGSNFLLVCHCIKNSFFHFAQLMNTD